MLKLDLAATERFVNTFSHPRQEFFWDGWTLVQFKPTPAGATHKRGMYRDGSWGIANRIDVDSSGMYRFRV